MKASWTLSPGLGKPAVLAQSSHLLPPPGEHFMDIALVPHVKDQPVPAGIEHPVDSHSQLHRSQVGGQMPPCPGHIPDQLLPELPAQRRGLLVAQVRQQRPCFFLLFLQVNPSHLLLAARPHQITGPTSPIAVPSSAPIST